jgi:uncharacterized membrane protein
MMTVGAIAGVATGLAGLWGYAPVVGWTAAALTFSAWIWTVITRMSAGQTAAHATWEDPSRATTELLILGANLASLAAVGFVLIRANSLQGAARGLLAGLALASVAASWLLVHTLYTLRYARLYYSGPNGGVNFNQEAPPRYTDFAYLAFTLGMTYQVSDTDLQTHAVRATALRHGLLSYLYGSVILATMINLVAGLSSGGH